MKLFLLFLLMSISPFVFVYLWTCAISWQILKYSFLHVKKEYATAHKEFYKL